MNPHEPATCFDVIAESRLLFIRQNITARVVPDDRIEALQLFSVKHGPVVAHEG